MIGWIIRGVYLLGYVLCWRSVVWALITDGAGKNPDGEDIFMGIFLGSLATVFWPLIAVGVSVRFVYQLRGSEIQTFVIPRRARRQINLEERERQIRALERELGIKEHVA